MILIPFPSLAAAALRARAASFASALLLVGGRRRAASRVRGLHWCAVFQIFTLAKPRLVVK